MSQPNHDGDLDKDRTPVVGTGASTADKNVKTSTSASTISRLESKYSDILDRVQKRKQKEKELDRDKTVEADRDTNKLLKSKTSAVIGATTQKERTPFSLRDKKSRYGLYNIDLGLSSITSAAIDPIRPTNVVDSTLGILSPYSSPYSALYSRHNNKAKDSYIDTPTDRSETSRQRPLKAYHRKNSDNERKLTAINLWDLEFEHRPRATTHRNYGDRRVKGPSKSKTQQFFESEDAFSPLADEELTDREKRRKDIQSIMQKYSQMDDLYPRAAPTATTSTSTTQNGNHYNETDHKLPKSFYDGASTYKNDLNNNYGSNGVGGGSGTLTGSGLGASNDFCYGNHYIADHYHIRSPENGLSGLMKSKTSANVAKQLKVMKSPSNHQMQTALVPLVMPGTAFHTGRRTRDQPARHHMLPFSTFVRCQ